VQIDKGGETPTLTIKCANSWATVAKIVSKMREVGLPPRMQSSNMLNDKLSRLITRVSLLRLWDP
jgi:hypothetical protein